MATTVFITRIELVKSNKALGLTDDLRFAKCKKMQIAKHLSAHTKTYLAS